MIALVAGLGFGLDYTGESWLTITSDNWGLIGLIAFVVFVIITLSREIDLALQQRPRIEVYPNSLAGMEIALVVHNKSQIKADISAVMTCAIDSGELMEDIKVNGLRNVSMCWEASVKASETINPGGRKILKLCSVRRIGTYHEDHRYMEFSKVESDSAQVIGCAGWSEGDAIPKVNVDIQLDSSITMKGQRSWRYQVFYLGDSNQIGIYDLKQSGRKSFIREGIRLD